MEGKKKEVVRQINKILKKLGRNDLDWTFQVSVSSVHIDKPVYACSIESPNGKLQPLVWMNEDYDKFIESLKVSAEKLNEKEVEKAWHKAEIERAKRLIEFHEEALQES